MELDELIKELDKKLIVTGKEIIDGIMYIYCETKKQITKCKYCGKESENVHSTYTRAISDLPIQNYKVKLIIKVKKYFCNNDKCKHTTFAEPLNFVEKNAIRTKRLDEYINNVGLKTSSIEAEKQIKSTHVDVSNNTILRIIKKKTKIEVNYEVENLGIDDFSSKKREIFNTIFVDNDKNKKVEVINSREKDNVVEKLKLFRKVKTVTRDFSQTYKNAITEALPKAKQIVDRFHILKNLTDDLNEYIKRNIKERIKMIDNKGKAVIEEEIILNRRQRNKKESAEKKWEVIQEVQKLYKEGYNKSTIAKKLNISRQTIYTYLNQKQPLEKSTNSILDPYIPMIKKLILEGKKVFEIYDEIKANGYKGKTSLFTSRLRGIRQEARTNIKYIKRSKIKKLLFYDIEEIKDENLKNDLKEYLETNKELNELLNMIRKFKEVIFSKKPRKLSKWIREAKKINVKELNSFVTLIESDIDAVKNAIKYDYSNGLTEGFNNKTKVIKRIMYGRCSFDLLRLKILA